MNTAGYLVTACLSVGLVLLLALVWSDLHGAKPRLVRFWLIVFLSGALIATRGRLIPGGPLLSVHGAILPAVGCLALLAYGARGFRAIDPDLRLVLAFAMLASAGMIAVVVANVLSFWKDPFARGALLAW